MAVTGILLPYALYFITTSVSSLTLPVVNQPTPHTQQIVGGRRDRWEAKGIQEQSTSSASKASSATSAEIGVPVFSVQGLTSKKGESLLFFSLTDLKAAWSKADVEGEVRSAVVERKAAGVGRILRQ